MTDVLRVNGVPLEHIDEHELTTLHSMIASAMRFVGLTAPSLDEAISAAFTSAVRIIERERAMQEKRRTTIREVT
jgi:hypothetical protein